MSVYTGDYLRQISSCVPKLTYFTFTPLPLMEGNFYTMDNELAALLSNTHRILGMLEGTAYALSDKEAFATCMLLRESYFSKMIDSSDYNADSLLLELALNKTDSEIKNLVTAYQNVVADTSELDYDHIASHALFGSSMEEKIIARTEQIFLMNSIANYQRYNPTAPQDIKPALNDISRYIESNTSDPLIKAAMCHYQFEMIHPYEHSNGIIGRLLIYHLLRNEGLEGIRYLSISEYLHCLEAEYFEKLEQTQKDGNYYAWIEFFIQAVGEAAKKSIQLLKQYESIVQSNKEKMDALGNRSEHLATVYQYFNGNIVSGIGQASQGLNIPFNAVSRAVSALQGLGILVQITNGARNRLFAHAGTMRLLMSQ